jgi:hypothetical protein
LSSKEFLVSDNHGSIFLTDWRSDPEEDSRRLNVIELVEPRALSDAVSGLGSAGVAAWRADNPDVYVFISNSSRVLHRGIIPGALMVSGDDPCPDLVFGSASVFASDVSSIPESAPHTDRGIPFGIFRICKEENLTSAVPGFQRVVTNSGKLLEISQSNLIVLSRSPSRIGSADGCRRGVYSI